MIKILPGGLNVDVRPGCVCVCGLCCPPGALSKQIDPDYDSGNLNGYLNSQS